MILSYVIMKAQCGCRQSRKPFEYTSNMARFAFLVVTDVLLSLSAKGIPKPANNQTSSSLRYWYVTNEAWYVTNGACERLANKASIALDFLDSCKIRAALDPKLMQWPLNPASPGIPQSFLNIG